MRARILGVLGPTLFAAMLALISMNFPGWLSRWWSA